MSGNDDTIGGVPTAPATRSPPVIAERYLVHKLIARGGMASVFLAEHIALRRPVALKILHPPVGLENSEDANFEKRFRLEAETLAALNHPNIVTLFDYGQTDDGRFFLAMEYIEGPRYTDVIQAGAIPVDHTITLLLQVCAALRYAHKRGVVHRDLKPSNLLIARDADGMERVKVVDFGLVKVGEVDQSLTREGIVLGSPHCMAPEQVQGLPIDHRADIYALGILLFRSITGAYPFHGNTATATMMAHLSEPIPAFAGVAPNLRANPRIEQIVRRCLAKKADDRYPDIATLAVDLQQAIGLVAEPEASQSLTLVEELPTPPPPRPAARRPVPWILVGAAAAAAAFLTVWFATRALSGDTTAQVLPPPPVADAVTAPVVSGLEVAPPDVTPPEAVPTEPVTTEPVEPTPVATRPTKTATPAVTKPATKPGTKPGTKPSTNPTTETTGDPKNPEGYMPLPDDLR